MRTLATLLLLFVTACGGGGDDANSLIAVEADEMAGNWQASLITHDIDGRTIVFTALFDLTQYEDGTLDGSFVVDDGNVGTFGGTLLQDTGKYAVSLRQFDPPVTLTGFVYFHGPSQTWQGDLNGDASVNWRPYDITARRAD